MYTLQLSYIEKDNENNKANTDSIVESSNNTTEETDNTITE